MIGKKLTVIVHVFDTGHQPSGIIPKNDQLCSNGEKCEEMRVTLPRDKSVTEYNLGVALRDARSFDYLDVTISKDLTRKTLLVLVSA